MHWSGYIRLGKLRVPTDSSSLLQVVGKDESKPRLASGPRGNQVLLVTEMAGATAAIALNVKMLTSLRTPSR